MTKRTDRRHAFAPAVNALEPRLALSHVAATAATPILTPGMPLPVLTIGQRVTAQPGEVFAFTPSPQPVFGTQYHIAVSTGTTDTVIAVYGPNVMVGKARNKAGQLFVDRTLPRGVYSIIVTGETGPYKVEVTKNSLGHKIFG